MHLILELLHYIFLIAIWVVIIRFILDLLVQFKVLDAGQAWVGNLSGLLQRLTEPALRPIRRFVPAMGGIDISPAILLLLIWILRYIVFRLLIGSMMM